MLDDAFFAEEDAYLAWLDMDYFLRLWNSIEEHDTDFISHYYEVALY